MSITRGSERKTDRLEAFSDAVLAIAMTLPLVDLKSPRFDDSRSLASQFGELGSHYVAYALSFGVIGVYWLYSHFSGKLWRKTDHGFNLLTLLFLCSVSITPFAALPFVEHLDDPLDAPIAASVYAWLLTAPALLWLLRWRYGVWRGLVDPHISPDYIRRLNRKYGLSSAAAVTGAVIASVLEWRVGIAIVALVTATFLLPPQPPQFKPGQEPRDDIQEADEERE